MQITATDTDEPGNPNSKIKYTLTKQEPPGDKMMFKITPDGELRVKEPNLDREVSLLCFHHIPNTNQYGFASFNIVVFCHILLCW